MAVKAFCIALRLVNLALQPILLNLSKLRRTTGTSAFYPLSPPVYFNSTNLASKSETAIAKCAIS